MWVNNKNKQSEQGRVLSRLELIACFPKPLCISKIYETMKQIYSRILNKLKLSIYVCIYACVYVCITLFIIWSAFSWLSRPNATVMEHHVYVYSEVIDTISDTILIMNKKRINFRPSRMRVKYCEISSMNYNIAKTDQGIIFKSTRSSDSAKAKCYYGKFRIKDDLLKMELGKGFKVKGKYEITKEFILKDSCMIDKETGTVYWAKKYVASEF